MRLLALIAVLWCVPWGASANSAFDCDRQEGLTNLPKLDESIGSSMHGHMMYVTCIAAALKAGNYANASFIAQSKLGLRTKGGQRSTDFGFREPSQALWEKGYAFRNQATRFSHTAQAMASVPSADNRNRVMQEYLQLLTLCQDCHSAFSSLQE